MSAAIDCVLHPFGPRITSKSRTPSVTGPPTASLHSPMSVISSKQPGVEPPSPARLCRLSYMLRLGVVLAGRSMSVVTVNPDWIVRCGAFPAELEAAFQACVNPVASAVCATERTRKTYKSYGRILNSSLCSIRTSCRDTSSSSP